MTMKELISAIEQKHKEIGITINPPASSSDIHKFEKRIGFELPADFKEFYSICNGFECTEDIFNMISLDYALTHHQDYGKDWFHFAEYMIFSDMWSLRRKNDGTYEIINRESEIILTSSLHEFLKRFLQGDVFEKGGLYDWHEELKPGWQTAYTNQTTTLSKKRETSSWLLFISNILLSGLFAFINLYEFVVVGILKQTGDYPFGGEGPTPWFYQSAKLYATVNFIFGLLFLLSFSIGVWSFVRMKRKIMLISFGMSLLLIVLHVLTAQPD